MDLISLIIGIAVGAVFSPFWIKLFVILKALFLRIVAKFKK